MNRITSFMRESAVRKSLCRGGKTGLKNPYRSPRQQCRFGGLEANFWKRTSGNILPTRQDAAMLLQPSS